jgi:hypothetical protein
MRSAENENFFLQNLMNYRQGHLKLVAPVKPILIGWYPADKLIN